MEKITDLTDFNGLQFNEIEKMTKYIPVRAGLVQDIADLLDEMEVSDLQGLKNIMQIKNENLETAEELLTNCLVIIAYLARKKANRIEIIEAAYNTELDDYLKFGLSWDTPAINTALKDLRKELEK